jgi:hypothetical protein
VHVVGPADELVRVSIVDLASRDDLPARVGASSADRLAILPPVDRRHAAVGSVAKVGANQRQVHHPREGQIPHPKTRVRRALPGGGGIAVHGQQRRSVRHAIDRPGSPGHFVVERQVVRVPSSAHARDILQVRRMTPSSSDLLDFGKRFDRRGRELDRGSLHERRPAHALGHAQQREKPEQSEGSSELGLKAHRGRWQARGPGGTNHSLRQAARQVVAPNGWEARPFWPDPRSTRAVLGCFPV